MGCPTAALAAEQSPTYAALLFRCSHTAVRICAATPRKEKPWKHQMLHSANTNTAAELDSRPPAIKYSFTALRWFRSGDQDTSLQRPKVLSEKIPKACCRSRQSVKPLCAELTSKIKSELRF